MKIIPRSFDEFFFYCFFFFTYIVQGSIDAKLSMAPTPNEISPNSAVNGCPVEQYVKLLCRSFGYFESEVWILNRNMPNLCCKKGKGETSHKKFVLKCSRTSGPFSRHLKFSTLYFRWYLCTIFKIFIYLKYVSK